MEGVAPLLEVTMCLRRSLCSGRSVRAAIRELPTHSKVDLVPELVLWLNNEVETFELSKLPMWQETQHRRELLEVLMCGLTGEPILHRLEQFEEEVILACKDELERHLQKLPVLALLPLVLLQFPAFLIIMLGPLFKHLLERMSL